jgi:hypothetical protein
MSLTWTPEMKDIAKADKKALVKLQVQLKHSTGGDFKIVGPMSAERGMALFLVGMLKDGDPKIGEILALLGKAMLPQYACQNCSWIGPDPMIDTHTPEGEPGHRFCPQCEADVSPTETD